MDRPTGIVTGASRGIGEAIALELAEEGFDIVLAARDEGRLHQVANEVQSRGVEALAVQTDVTENEAVVKLVEQATGQFGSIDVLVNNAGTSQSTPTPLWELPDEEWQAVLDVNLNGMYRCAREVLSQGMFERGEGTIVNLSSITGKTGVANHGAYVASKHGIQGLTNVLAKELRDTDIRVSAVCPGQVETDMTEGIAEVDLLDPSDVAEAVRFLVGRDPDVYVPEIVLLSPDSIPLYSH